MRKTHKYDTNNYTHNVYSSNVYVLPLHTHSKDPNVNCFRYQANVRSTTAPRRDMCQPQKRLFLKKQVCYRNQKETSVANTGNVPHLLSAHTANKILRYHSFKKRGKTSPFYGTKRARSSAAPNSTQSPRLGGGKR